MNNMSKENLKQNLRMLMNYNGLGEINLRSNILKKDISKILQEFHKKAWLNTNYQEILVSLLYDFRHMIHEKSIEQLEGYVK